MKNSFTRLSTLFAFLAATQTIVLVFSFGFTLFSFALSENNPLDVIIQDLKIYVDGKEFFVKGIAYNPVPLGWINMTVDGYDGTGFCSPKLTPFNEWKSACYDSDYADGYTYPGRYPPPPPNGWWSAVWERDFPIMKELGVNTLRLYNVNPTTHLYVKKYLNVDPDIKVEVGPQHRPFLDKALEYGFKVIFPILNDEATIRNNPIDKVIRWLQAQIDEVGDHPALLMWIMGNELDLSNNPQMVQFLNGMFDVIRNYTYKTFRRRVPVTSAVVDYPPSYDTLVRILNVDVFTANAGYRGFTLGNLWDGDPSAGFSGFKTLSRLYGKPLLIGEQGFPGDEQVNVKYPTWFNSQWKDIVTHIDDSGVVGSIFFEYNDEPYKGCLTCIDQKLLGVVNFTVWVGPDGTNSLQPNVWTPDIVTRKDIIFEAVKNGSYDGKPYNMNADVWQLLGRPRSILPDWKPNPTAFPIPLSTPMSNSNNPTSPSNPQAPHLNGISQAMTNLWFFFGLMITHLFLLTN